jgi:hypothetical protein
MDRTPEALESGRHSDMADAELGERIDQRVPAVDAVANHQWVVLT